MTAFASDAFTDTAGTTLGAHDANWNLVTSYSIGSKTNGSAVYITAFGNSAYRYAATPPAADYSVSLDVVIQSGTGPVLGGPCGRVSASAATFYHAQYNVSAGAWRLWKSVSGTFTQLGSDVSQSLTVGQAYRLKLEMIGTAIKLYVDGVLKISVTDSSISAAGFPGLRIGQSAGSVGGTTGLQLDNFSADPIGAGAVLAATEQPDTVAFYASQVEAFPRNVAKQVNGGVASASSAESFREAAYANDDVIGVYVGDTGTGSVWLATAPPAWWECDFDATYTLTSIVVYSAQDSPAGNTNPSGSLTASSYEVKDFTIEAWDGSAWQTLGSVTANDKVKYTLDLSSSPYTTNKIRISVTAVGTTGYVILDEVRAFGSPAASSAALAAAEAADVVAIAAKSLNVSAIAGAESADVVAIAAAAINAAAMVATEQADVIAIFAAAVNAAALAGTESADAVAISGVESNDAALAAVEDPDVAVFNSLGGNDASVHAQESPDVVAIDGSIIELAALGATESPDVVAVEAREGQVAAIAVTEQPDTAHIVAQAVNLGSLAGTEQPDAIAISAISESLAAVGGTEAPDVADIQAQQRVDAILAALEQPDVVAVFAAGGTIISLPACVRVSHRLATELDVDDERVTLLAADMRLSTDLTIEDRLNCEGPCGHS